MSYDSTHTDDHCDKCGERVGFLNLRMVPFLYLDVNDHVHRDLSPEINAPIPGYRQYWVCKKCWMKKWGDWK